MLLRNYLNSLYREIEKLEDYGYIESVEINEEMRAIKQVIVNVRIIFLNGSELYIREYIDARYKIERVSWEECKELYFSFLKIYWLYSIIEDGGPNAGCNI